MTGLLARVRSARPTAAPLGETSPAAGSTKVERCGSIEQLETEWDELAERLGAPPSAFPGWARAWWGAFGRGQLMVFAARRSGELVGVLPMRRTAAGLASCSNAHSIEFAPLALDRGAERALWGAALSVGVSRLQLRFARLDAIEALCFAAHDAGYALTWTLAELPPQVSVRGSWKEFEATRSAKVLADLRRRERRLGEVGRVRSHTEDGSTGLAALLEEGFAIEGSGWKRVAGTAIESRPETRSFYTDLARWGAARGMLRLSFVRVDDRPVAFEYALEHAGTYFFLKGGYDTDFARHSPGRLLVRHVLQRAFDERLACFDFGGVDEPFKLEWADSARVLVDVDAFGRSAAGLALRVAAPAQALTPVFLDRVRARLRR